MKLKLIHWYLLLLVLVIPNTSHAAMDNCIGVYVGRISVDAQNGLDMVVFLAMPESGSGSYWVSFTGWDYDAKKQALSILLAAKAARHRVDVYTTATGSCSIGSPGQVLRKVHISTNP